MHRHNPMPSKSPLDLAIERLGRLSDDELSAEFARLEAAYERTKAPPAIVSFSPRHMAQRRDAQQFALAHLSACRSEMKRRGLTQS